MTTRIYKDLEQGSDEWLEARRGIVTASVVGQLITPSTVKVAANDKSRALVASLAAERITGHIEPVFVSDDMYRGQVEEPIARALYGQRNNVIVDEIGFMTTDEFGPMIGYSPDGLVGDDGLIEIKSRRQKKHLQTIVADAVPVENVAQLQCGLLVTGRAWIDYVSYCGGMPMWVKRMYPDQRWFDAIITAAETFEAQAAQIIETYTAAVAGLPGTERTDLEERIVI